MDGVNILTKVPSIDGAFYMVRKEVYMRLLNWLNSYEFQVDDESIKRDIDKRYLVELIDDELIIHLRAVGNQVNDPKLIERLLTEYHDYINRSIHHGDTLDHKKVKSKIKSYPSEILETDTNDTFVESDIDKANDSYVYKLYKLKTLNDDGDLLSISSNYDDIHNTYREYIKWYFLTGTGRNILFDHRDYSDNLEMLGVEVIRGKSKGAKNYYKIVKEKL